MTNASVFLIMFIACCAGFIWLQVFLSRQESKWPGLILPILSFLLSLVVVAGMISFTAIPRSETRTYAEDGTLIETVIDEPIVSEGAVGSAVLLIIFVLLIYNIPTAVLVAIYAACRSKMRQRQALDHMRIQDLT